MAQKPRNGQTLIKSFFFQYPVKNNNNFNIILRATFKSYHQARPKLYTHAKSI